MENSLHFDTNLTYCPNTLIVNQPLNLSNTSDQQIAFKIKTNQKNLLSMSVNHGFLKPFSTLSVPIKIVQHVSQDVKIKLQLNWCKVTAQMKEKNDSKMALAPKQHIFKKVFPIERKPLNQCVQSVNKSNVSQGKQSVYQSVYESKRSERQQSKITPFQYQNQKIEQQKGVKGDEQVAKDFQKTSSKIDKLGYNDQQQQVADYIQQRKQFIQTTQHSPTKNLEIVSQQDEDDHQKQLQQIKSEQIQQRRKIDELKSKIRKLAEQNKAKQFIDAKLLGLIVVSSYVVGGFLQYLIF